jgi:hypothetical protein
MKTHTSTINDTNRKQIIPFVYTYNPYIPQVQNILNSHLKILVNSCSNKFINTTKILAVPRRCRNMRDMLVRSDLNHTSKLAGSYQCGQQCITCQYIQNSCEFNSTNTKKSYKIHGHYTCTTPSVIYLITCKFCQLQYVGQTSNTFRERFYGHMADIRAKNDVKPISHHFGIYHDENINVIIITQTERNTNTRLRTEELWIRKLRTKMPEGMNLI